MSVEVRWNAEQQLIRAKIEGMITLEELASTLRAFVASGEHRPDAPSLWDVRAFDFERVDRRFTEAMVGVRRDRPERGAVRIALLVADDLGFGMMRMYALMSDDLPQQIDVFRDEDAAVRWLRGD